MPDKILPLPRPQKFSRRFNEALVTTSLLNAMVKADGWRLDDFVEAPAWLRQLYNRHAAAAYKDMKAIDAANADQTNIKPFQPK